MRQCDEFGSLFLNCAKLFLDRWSAALLYAPKTCEVVMEMSKYAVRNHKVRSSCITAGSFDDPLFMTIACALMHMPYPHA